MNMGQELRGISPRELAVLGVQDVAFVKPVVADGVSAFAIHAADGTQIGLAPNHDVAFAAIRQHDLEPVSVH